MDRSVSQLRKSFAIQSRVIGALLLREVITRYGRHNIGFLWLVLEPMLFTLGITAAWTLAKQTHGSHLPITAFAVTGYSSILLWRNCSNRIVKSIEPNLSLLYHRNVKILDIFAARLILEIAGATASFAVLTITFSAAGWMSLPEDLLTALVGWILLIWFTSAISLIVGAASERSELVERVWHIVTYLTLPISGIAFMMDWLPKTFRDIVFWFPMVQGTEMIRHGFFGSAVRTYEDPAYFVIINTVISFIGLALVNVSSSQLEAE